MLNESIVLSQCNSILAYLQNGNKITPIEALNKFDCFRLSARIAELRKDGYAIKTEIIHKGNKRFAEYSIEK